MIFTNYSQTYAAAIATMVGFLAMILAMFGVELADAQIQFVAGTFLNFFGIVWQVAQRYRKGDVTTGGFRKNVTAS